jgi:hypothetical protein
MLVWQGRPQEARTLIRTEAASLQTDIEAAEAALNELRAKQRMINEIGPEPVTARISVDGPMGVVAVMGHIGLNKVTRNKKVLELAKVSLDDSGFVDVNVLARKLSTHGVEMGVSDNRVNTALANILSKSGGYSKVHTGLFSPPKSKKPDVLETPGFFSPTASEQAL